MSLGWMCVKMNEDIAEIIAAEIFKRFGKSVWESVILLLKFNHEKRTVVWEICLRKCDFTAEIQPRKTARLCRRRLVKENKEKLYLSHLLC